jgi:hypothetical protein
LFAEASGHAAAPESPAMNSRRFIAGIGITSPRVGRSQHSTKTNMDRGQEGRGGRARHSGRPLTPERSLQRHTRGEGPGWYQSERAWGLGNSIRICEARCTIRKCVCLMRQPDDQTSYLYRAGPSASPPSSRRLATTFKVCWLTTLYGLVEMRGHGGNRRSSF